MVWATKLHERPFLKIPVYCKGTIVFGEYQQCCEEAIILEDASHIVEYIHFEKYQPYFAGIRHFRKISQSCWNSAVIKILPLDQS
ncbi:hypothetical protein [Virgibacillus oceani]|uniref:hypothetical protein n=1 Tax=Virgibacillus oceani TaxID=1479511 RepID=UPI00166CD315|nr:hypothetical protein [Virgibacillus oceani]